MELCPQKWVWLHLNMYYNFYKSFVLEKLIVGQTNSSNFYTVKRGDTLEAISNLYNIPRAEIIRINNLIINSYLITNVIKSIYK